MLGSADPQCKALPWQSGSWNNPFFASIYYFEIVLQRYEKRKCQMFYFQVIRGVLGVSRTQGGKPAERAESGRMESVFPVTQQPCEVNIELPDQLLHSLNGFLRVDLVFRLPFTMRPRLHRWKFALVDSP